MLNVDTISESYSKSEGNMIEQIETRLVKYHRTYQMFECHIKTLYLTI